MRNNVPPGPVQRTVSGSSAASGMSTGSGGNGVGGAIGGGAGGLRGRAGSSASSSSSPPGPVGLAGLAASSPRLKPAPIKIPLFAWVWVGIVVVGTAWNVGCDQHAVDRRASAKADCVVLKGSTQCSELWPAACLHPRIGLLLAPRALGNLVAWSGPALGWLALLWGQKGWQHLVHVPAMAFLLISMPLRYLHTVSSFDPSGHIAVIGLGLVPLVLGCATGRVQRLPSRIVVVLMGFYYVTFMTSMLFHSALETWTSVVYVIVTTGAGLKLVQGRGMSLATSHQLFIATSITWGVSVLATVVLAEPGSIPMLVASILYDVALLALLYFGIPSPSMARRYSQ